MWFNHFHIFETWNIHLVRKVTSIFGNIVSMQLTRTIYCQSRRKPRSLRSYGNVQLFLRYTYIHMMYYFYLIEKRQCEKSWRTAHRLLCAVRCWILNFFFNKKKGFSLFSSVTKNYLHGISV